MNAPRNNPLLCNREDTVLVLIDIQERLSDAMPDKVIARVKRKSGVLLIAADKLGIPVMVTEQYPKGLGPLDSGIAQLLPKATTRFEKTCFSCTGADGFSQQLEQTGRRQVVLTGMESHVCVLQTAMDLRNSGYQVFIATDAVCSRHREEYESSLLRMSQAGVITTYTESILFEWLQDATQEHFKTLSALIR